MICHHAAGLRTSCCGIVIAVALILVGCDNGPAMYSVSGQVSYDGRPVPSGKIYFEPDTDQGGTGLQGLAVIKNGHYETLSGRGVGWGVYKVKIIGYDGKPTTESGEELPDGKPLFDPYETTLDLPRQSSSHDITVPVRPDDEKSNME